MKPERRYTNRPVQVLIMAIGLAVSAGIITSILAADSTDRDQGTAEAVFYVH